MQIKELNEIIRFFILKTIEDTNCKRKTICDVTLGNSFGPQFKSFIDGDDLGLNPLTRLIEGLGFKLHLIPINENNNEILSLLETQTKNFIDESKKELINYIKNKPKAIRIAEVSSTIKLIVDDLINDL